MPNKTYKKQTPITLISNEWIIIIIIIILTQVYTYMQLVMMMGMMMMMNFKDFAKVDDSVLLWHPICKCSSIMLIFILALFSAGKSKGNFPKKFLKHENQRLYSTSFFYHFYMS